MLEVIYLSLVTTIVSLTVTRAYVFQDIRGWVVPRLRFKIFKKFITCHECLSYWVAANLVLFVRVETLETGNLFFNLVLTWLVVVAVSFYLSALALFIARLAVGEEE